jgi:hypothetical protein
MKPYAMGEYHSGDPHLRYDRLYPVTKWVKSAEEIHFAVRQLEKYNTPWVILRWCSAESKRTVDRGVVRKELGIYKFALFREG